MNKLAFIVGLFLFCTGIYLHVGLEALWESNGIFGDNGDGFFNLWLLEKGNHKLFDFDLKNFTNGGIFWPENNYSYFLSENYLLYAPIYEIMKSLSGNIFQSYSWLSLLLVLAGFLSHYFLFSVVYKAFTLEGSHPSYKIMIPFLAYFATFSEAKIRYFIHWQNLSYFWLVLCLGSMIAYSAKVYAGRVNQLFFSIIVITPLFLLLSSVYFSLVACTLIVIWSLLQFSLNFEKFFRSLFQLKFFILATLLIFATVAYFYTQVKLYKYSEWVAYGYATRFWHLVLPAAGMFREILESFGIKVPVVDHEACAYIGLGASMSAVLLFVAFRKQILERGQAMLQSKVFWMTMLLLIATRLIRYFSPAASGFLIVLTLFSLLMYFVLRLRSVQEGNKVVVTFSILGASLLVFYGISFGPLRHYIDRPFNGSLYGLFKTFFPPIGNMRAIGRVAGLGHSALLASLFAAYLLYVQKNSQKKQQGMAITAVIICFFLQFSDPLGVKAHRSHYDLSAVTPQIPMNHDWWKDKKGSAVVFPSNPYHHNVSPMLYFSHFSDLNLLNGYSTRSLDHWTKVMEMGRGQAEPTSLQIDYVKNIGTDWILLDKQRVQANIIAKYRKQIASKNATSFEDDKFLVVKSEYL